MTDPASLMELLVTAAAGVAIFMATLQARLSTLERRLDQLSRAVVGM